MTDKLKKPRQKYIHPDTGEEMTIYQLHKQTGIPESTLRDRLAAEGEINDRVLSPNNLSGHPPINFYPHPVTGKQVTLRELSNETGIPVTTLKYRIKRGGDKLTNEMISQKTLLKQSTYIHPITGKEVTIREIAEEIGLGISGATRRIKKCGGFTQEVLDQEYWQQGRVIPTAKQYISPHNGETGTRRYWCKKWEISENVFYARLQKYGWEKMSHPNFKASETYYQWSEEQDNYLIQIWEHPQMLRLYNKKAKEQGWYIRSRKALHRRITALRKQGKLDEQKHRALRKNSEWMTVKSLATSLDCDRTTIMRWLNDCDLPRFYSERNEERIMIHTPSFIKWVLSKGRDEFTRVINNRPKGLRWFLNLVPKYWQRKPGGNL